jgi:hypothetical protein
VVDEQAFTFGGVEFGDDPGAPEQFPLVFAVLWYIIESPSRENFKSSMKNLWR